MFAPVVVERRVGRDGIFAEITGGQLWELDGSGLITSFEAFDSWDDALDRLARHMKDSRDKKTVLKDSAGLEVNRNEGYGFVGGATITSEEGYLTAKFFRAMGCVYLEQQARV